MMGTASYGIHGSGSGMGSGGGDAGGAFSFGGQMGAKPYDTNVIKSEVSGLIKELFARAPLYIHSMFHNTYLTEAYAELFAISALLRGEQPSEKIGARYGINMSEPLFIINLINELDQKFRTGDVDPRIAEAIRITLEKVLFKAVREDPYLSIDGSGNEVVEAMRLNTAFWNGLSGQVLANLAITIYKKDAETKIPQAAVSTANEIERRTNQVIESYKEKSGDQSMDYQSLFQYIDQHWDWFKEEMTK